MSMSFFEVVYERTVTDMERYVEDERIDSGTANTDRCRIVQ